LEKATLKTLKGGEKIGFRKFEGLTIDYTRELEFADGDEMDEMGEMDESHVFS
jgi:hypothetical protein